MGFWPFFVYGLESRRYQWKRTKETIPQHKNSCNQFMILLCVFPFPSWLACSLVLPVEVSSSTPFISLLLLQRLLLLLFFRHPPSSPAIRAPPAHASLSASLSSLARA